MKFELDGLSFPSSPLGLRCVQQLSLRCYLTIWLDFIEVMSPNSAILLSFCFLLNPLLERKAQFLILCCYSRNPAISSRSCSVSCTLLLIRLSLLEHMNCLFVDVVCDLPLSRMNLVPLQNMDGLPFFFCCAVHNSEKTSCEPMCLPPPLPPPLSGSERPSK